MTEVEQFVTALRNGPFDGRTASCGSVPDPLLNAADAFVALSVSIGDVSAHDWRIAAHPNARIADLQRVSDVVMGNLRVE
jgi:hypothetical protein